MSLAFRRFLRVSHLQNALIGKVAQFPQHSNTDRFSTFACVQSRHRPSASPRAVDVETEDYASGAFGSLAEKHGVQVFKLPPEMVSAPGEDEEEDRPRRRSRNSPYWYFLQCKKLAKERKTVECLKFLEEKMLKEDRVFPEEYNFTVVIGALGRIGYAKKAFQLYNQLKDRGLRPTVATYTALFNAVAQSPYSTDIKKAFKLYAELHRKKLRLNRVVYNAALKAFGMHGTTEQMMGIFRESIIAGFEPDSETFDMLLLSLDKDKEAGFRHAIEVWRQMIMLGIKPEGKTVLYLLKVLKNCGIGDPDTAYRKLIVELPDPADYKDFFKRHLRNVYWLKGQQSHPRTHENPQLPPTPEMITLESGEVSQQSASDSQFFNDDLVVNGGSLGTNEEPSLHNETWCEQRHEVHHEVVQQQIEAEIVTKFDSEVKKSDELPNLLTLPFDNLEKRENAIVPLEITKCNLPSDRLALIGGYRSMLEILEKYDIAPTVMVLSSLIRVMEHNAASENEVIAFAERWKVKLDIDFYNTVLRNRVGRRGQGAMQHIQEILRKIAESRLTPNYRTWCVTALSCTDGVRGVELINEVKNTTTPLDHVFYNSLISAALRGRKTRVQGYKGVFGYDYRYLTRIVHEMRTNGVKANRHTIGLLETASEWPEGYNRWEVADTEFEQKVFRFREVYKEWLDAVEVVEQKKPFQEFRKRDAKPIPAQPNASSAAL